ncbi:hypothetical protein [Aliamphritea hakodatensis]|uniref:hypothetical protein n=1 Tax=Aliamphritea hakodatensis TaxID=2895352 RepID=UPI0022FD9A7D|nr:hypothetical protein [Aliamphritea hakodatensis]
MAKSAAKRKAEQLQREKEHREAVGAQLFQMDMFRRTREHLDKLKSDHGFEEDGEVVTLLIHNIANCDMSRQKELLAVPQHKGNQL